MASITSAHQSARVEDVLAQLPISTTMEYGKGQMVYGPNRPSKSIYLVVRGKVDVSQIAVDGSEILLEIVRPDELFGESALLGDSSPYEKATAIENAKVMSWSTADLEDLVMKRPGLAMALLQVLAKRNVEFTQRIQSFALDNIERRLARSLIRFSERLGTRAEDGPVVLAPMTHVRLSRYVGTSREIVTQYMNRFRKRGYLSYSRAGIRLDHDSLKTLLD